MPRGPSLRFRGSFAGRLIASAKSKRAVARAKAVVLCTEPEADIYREFCPQANSTIVCNGVDLDYFSPRDVAPTVDCLFVGYLDYRANVTGLQWFCEYVWPRVRQRHPHAVFQIVGRNPIPAVQRLGEIAGVEVVGPVGDVRDSLSRARVVVVPLLVARGVQNKVLEAMAMGKTVVASPPSLTGLGVCAGKHVLAAEAPNDWVSAISSVLSNDSQAAQLGAMPANSSKSTTAGTRACNHSPIWSNWLLPVKRASNLCP